MRPARLWILNDRKAVFQTEAITGPPQGKTGAEEITVLMPRIYLRGIVDDMSMDMGVVDVRGNDKLMLALCPAHRQLVADLLGLLRRDLTGLEGLPDLIQQHIAIRDLPAGMVSVGPLCQKHLVGGGGRIAAVCHHQLAAQGLGRIDCVFYPLMDSIGNGLIFDFVHGNQARGCHAGASFRSFWEK